MIKQDHDTRMESLKRSKASVATICEKLEIEIEKCSLESINIEGKDPQVAIIEIRASQIYTKKLKELIAFFQDGDIMAREDPEEYGVVNQHI